MLYIKEYRKAIFIFSQATDEHASLRLLQCLVVTNTLLEKPVT